MELVREERFVKVKNVMESMELVRYERKFMRPR